MAEQLAMADLISGGRVLSGFVRGVGVETWWSNVEPGAQPRALRGVPRSDPEVLDGAGPVPLGGRHYHFRHVNPWCLPLQKPHPPIWIPGTASPETAVWAGRRGYTYVPFLVPFEIAPRAVRLLPPGRRRGRPDGDAGQPRLPHLRRHRGDEGEGPRGRAAFRLAHGTDACAAPVECFAPVGMRSRAGSQFALRARPRSLATMSYDELLEGQFIIAGTPDEVIDRFARVAARARASATSSWKPRSRAWTIRPRCARSSMMGAKVIPAVAGALATQPRRVSKNSCSRAPHSACEHAAERVDTMDWSDRRRAADSAMRSRAGLAGPRRAYTTREPSVDDGAAAHHARLERRVERRVGSR